MYMRRRATRVQEALVQCLLCKTALLSGDPVQVSAQKHVHRQEKGTLHTGLTTTATAMPEGVAYDARHVMEWLYRVYRAIFSLENGVDAVRNLVH